SEHHGLKVSPRLGSSFSSNGDFYGVSYNGDAAVQGVGFGNHPDSKGASAAPGPTVVGTMRREGSLATHDRFLVQDFAFPSLFAGAAQTAMSAFCGQVTRPTEAALTRQLHDLALQSPYSDGSA